MTPLARSLEYLRNNGLYAESVERWDPYAKVKHDLFGMFDIIAYGSPPCGIVGIQSTVTEKINNRIEKIKSEEYRTRLVAWLKAGGRVFIHGWSKMGPRGKRKVWELSEIPITMADL